MGMKCRILLVAAGVGVGYVLGARAGRERYDEIVAAYRKVRDAPLVASQVDRTKQFIDDRLDDVSDLVNAGAKKLVDLATGASKRSKRPAAGADAS